MYTLGTHNSWSYLPERKQWMKCTRFLARCQNCDIKTQYYAGARCFDLRLRWNDKYQDFVLCHGITTYVGVYEFDLSWLNIKAQERKENIYVRVLLEDSTSFTALSTILIFLPRVVASLVISVTLRSTLDTLSIFT